MVLANDLRKVTGVVKEENDCEYQESSNSALDPYDRPAKHTVASQTMGIARVPLESIKSNMESVLGDCAEIFKNVSATLGNCRMEYVDVSLGLAVDGSVGVLGSKLGAEAKGGIVVRLVFKDEKGV